MPPMLRPALASLVVTAALGAGNAAASAPSVVTLDAGDRARASFVRGPWRWPSRRITYFNAARGNAWAVRRAVRAWNNSGTRLRFRKASRSRARVIIRYVRRPGCFPGGFAPISYDRRSGLVVNAEVRLSRPDPRQGACSRWALALVAAHELGHVLGLAHEPRRCALMNSTAVNLSPALCQPGPLEPWRWRCRILEPDDVRGAVRIFGGRVKRRGRPVCDLFRPPIAPGALTAGAGPTGGLAVSFQRPPSPTPPRHVVAGPGSWVLALGRDVCPAIPEEGERGYLETGWTVGDGGVQSTTVYPLAPGRYCVSVWARDGVGRLGAPATTLVDHSG